MSSTDANYLLHDQYKDASNLNARIQLHKRFSQNKDNWQRWVFDHIRAEAGSRSRMLELGSGPGQLWVNNLDRIPADWEVTLSDFSSGMVEEEKHHLGTLPHFSFQIINIQAIPYANESFDVVIANHMLYHVPDLTQALSEISRVLKPSGYFYAATNGKNHMREADTLMQQFIPAENQQDIDTHTNTSFRLEEGADLLTPYFSNVTMQPFKDALRVTEAESLLDYMLSEGPVKHLLTGERLAALREHIQHEIDTHGHLYITKDTGLFEAAKLAQQGD
jgi:ubiquinone/menaquinone biosynthesis C-methylase UbiE